MTDVPEKETESGETAWRRLHPRVVWVDALLALLSLTPLAVSVTVFEGRVDGAFWISGAVIGVTGVTKGVSDGLRWFKTWYRITDTHIELRTGLLHRSHRTVRRDRIRSVDTSAKLRHRLAGLRIVVIGAGQQSAGEPAFALDAVSRGDAEWLDDHLIIGRAVSAEPDEPVADTSEPETPAETVHPIAAVRWGWLPYNAITVWGLLLAAGVLWGAYWALGGFGIRIDRWALGLADWESLGPVRTVLVAFAAVWLFGVIGMSVNFVAEWWRFRLDRVSTGGESVLRTSQGLFSTRVVNRDDRRLRGAEMIEPLPWRWAKAADTNVISTGLSGGSLKQNAAATVLPRAPRAESRRVIGEVLGDPVISAPLRGHPLAALRRRIGWAVNTTVVLAAIVWYLEWTDVLPGGWWPWCGVILPVGVVLAFAGWRALGHAATPGYLAVRSGAFYRTTVALRRDAVIGVTVRQSVLQRRLGLATVTLTTGAGSGGYAAVDADAGDAVDFGDEVSAGLLEPFLTPRAE
ncbi:putative membrane protein [Stackebrandtia albiflava]|uniref:Putative membrane protein n=1 Tax=Stackebrandtia albiflava TaxID=406432 RepID=A0A562V1Y3_9ACTN|nr:PH domain-containing protein [Stackebrandtia albiflava]TWJ11855.1 putative membrane protein [Stackebrandtia albiflava]